MPRFARLFLAATALTAGASVLGSGCSRESKARTLFVGVDGASWDVMTPMLERGELPHLAALIARGVASPLETFQPSLSPIIWTSIATGKVKEKHGITDFVTVDADGRERPVRSNERKARALWEILGENGRSVGIVGWWLTWPAESVDGFMVSSYSALAAGVWKGSAYAGMPGQVYPESLAPELDALIEREQMRASEEANGLFGSLAPEFGNKTQKRVIRDTVAVLLSDRIFMEAAKAFGSRDRPDFLAVYSGVVDVASHRFWKYYRPEDLRLSVTPEEIAALGSVIPNAYRWVDARVGELVEKATPDTTVIVASDHGFHAETRPGMSDDERSGGHERALLPGIIIAAGPGIRHADLRTSPPSKLPTVFDVAPTILRLHGLPSARDMDGVPYTAFFDLESLSAHPLEREWVTTYEVRPRSEPKSLPDSEVARRADDAIRERLRSLGYLKR